MSYELELIPAGMPPRPAFPGGPDGAEETRIALVSNMECVLDEDWEDVLRVWVAEHVGERRAQQWGPVDTSTNDLSDLCRQLSTPGLYGRRGVIRHADPAALPLIDHGGALDDAGLFPKMQQVQYKAIGLGDYLVGPHVDAAGTVSLHVRSPRNVHAVADPARPDEFREFWDLQLHALQTPGGKRPAWVWVQYRIDPAAPDDEDRTYYRAVLASSISGMGSAGSFRPGADVSNLVLSTPDNPGGDFKGAAYPFRVNGQIVIPWVKYSSVDGGGLWNHLARRGAYHGTLNAGLLSTYTQQAARDATGTAVLTAGLIIPSEEVRNTGGQMITTRTTYITPGGIIEAKFDPEANGQQPFVKELGAGANVTSLADYQARYSARILTRFGLNPSDVTRQAANPASAASLVVSDRGRRDWSRQMEPLFRRADVRLIAMVAAMSNQHAGTAYPERGYSIEYHQIPDSPTEERVKLDRYTWELDQGQLSELGLYQRLHPGASEADAMQALAQVEIDKRRLQAEIRAGLEAAGIVDEASKSEMRDSDITAAIELARSTAANEVSAESAIAIATHMLGLSAAAAGEIMRAGTVTPGE